MAISPASRKGDCLMSSMISSPSSIKPFIASQVSPLAFLPSSEKTCSNLWSWPLVCCRCSSNALRRSLVVDAFAIFHADAKSILSETGGFIAQAGFTHSLTPARNCGFACTYCYVPTMGIYGGLKPEDWRRWGQFTTFKANAPDLLARSLRPDQVIYCSPPVGPYPPAEASATPMPPVLDALLDRPAPRFCHQHC